MVGGFAGVFGILVLPVLMLVIRLAMVFFESSAQTIDIKRYRKIISVYAGLFVLPLALLALHRVVDFPVLGQLVIIVQSPLILIWFFMHVFYMPRVYVQRARAVGKGKGLAYLGTVPIPLFIPFPLFDLIAMIMLYVAKEPALSENT